MNISLYIPHIFANYSKSDVAQIFEDQGIGKVSHIDFVSKLGQDNKEYNAAYIHFDYWFANTIAANFQERVLNSKKEARIMYEDPWYWIVLENKARKIAPGDRKPRIDLGEFPALSSSNVTPVKAKAEKKCPDAPAKAKTQTEPVLPIAKCLEFDEEVADEMEELMETDAQMDEIEALIEEEESYLVNIDSRYIQSLEAENLDLRAQLVYFQNALCVEQIKTQALAEAIGKSK